MSRRIVFGILFLLSTRFTACSSDDGQLRDFYVERGISHCLAGNCMQGEGKVKINESLVYEGHFVDYVPDGQGSLYEEGKLLYSGQWEYGSPSNEKNVIVYSSKEDGTQSPATGKLGPKVKDYGDQGFWNVLGALLTCRLNRTTRTPGRSP